jgi:uncharacterized protein
MNFMKTKFLFGFLLFAFLFSSWTRAEEPLRVFIRGGVKTHGPGQHDHPRFLGEWTQLLTDRGATVAGSMDFPSAAQLEKADVLVMYAAEAATILPDQRAYLEPFLERGGGMVVIHDAVCGNDPHWFKTVVGGAWEHRHSKWHEGDVGIYFLDQDHPITRGVSNFEFNDEIYYDLHMMPEAKVLASSFHDVFTIAPQMWVYEKENYRAFVCLQGHEYASFNLPHFRAILLRGIAWAGKREADLFLSQVELDSLKYPEGGPIAPEKAHEKLVVHPEFNINLVTSEPLIEKPLSLDWDAQGRLWVAETPEYPGGRRIHRNDAIVAIHREGDPEATHSQTEDRPARDRISYLEDTNGDGVMDKKTVFYDGLELVTSLVFYRDGVIVSQAPDIYWLRDTNGDGKADAKEIIFTGFGNFDTHAVISNMRWGMDGWIYATQGYSGAQPRSPDGSKEFGRFGSGVLRFKPDGSAIEMVASKGGNTWGLDFAADGELFFTQATSGDHLNHVVLPEKVLSRGRIGSTASFRPIQDHRHVVPLIDVKKQPYVQIDVVGGFTAASGSAIYTGGAWPAKHDGSHFLTEPTVNLVHQDFISPTGSTYVASKDRDEEFIAGTDLWFRPVHARIGPDGALYVLDFYNQAVVHNDTRGPKHGAANAAVRPDRDHHFGRIWRVQHRDAKALPAVQLDAKKPADLVKALEHPNGWARMRAHRLLSESKDVQVTAALEAVVRSSKNDYARVHALWVLDSFGRLSPELAKTALNDSSAMLRKNVLAIMSESGANASLENEVIARLNDSDPRAKLQALVALGSFFASESIAEAVVAAYPSLNDPWQQSAAIGVAAAHPGPFLEAAFASRNPPQLRGFVGELGKQIALQDPNRSALAVMIAANKPAATDPLKRVLLENLGAGLKPDAAPRWIPPLETAFKNLLNARDESVATVALPLIAQWDQSESLRPEVNALTTKLLTRLNDEAQPADTRALLASSLVGVRHLNPEILPSITAILSSSAPPPLQSRIIQVLGTIPDAAAGSALAKAFAQLPPQLQEEIFNEIIKRPEWSLALLGQIQERAVPLTALSPASVHRLRTHTDALVSDRASQVIEEIRGPELKEKNELIARFIPVVRELGNIEKGREVYTQNCANCHQFNGEGSNLGPDISGMGAHGPIDLLVHILDPNRVVEPNYVTYSIETKDDLVFDGIIVRENNTSVVIRNAAGEFEIRRDNILSQRNTGRSLMPDGFESLGEEPIRDMISYLMEGETQFRVLDMASAFTANSTRGIYANQNDPNIRFKKFGLIRVGEIPFEIAHPAKTPAGHNLIVLKGGQGFSKTLPRKVEINAGVQASALHFLGGVGGWAWPCCGENKNENMPVVKVTLHFADGLKEEMVLRNGQEFADYNGKHEVPGSKEVPDLLHHGQIRWFSRPVKNSAVIERITLESFDNAVAPTLVGITAELSGGSSPAANAAATNPTAAEDNTKIRALIVGGDSHHDFDRWFNQEDVKILEGTGRVSARYTDKPETILPALEEIDVLYLSNNQPLPGTALRQGIADFAQRGNGLLLVHAALWYSWNDWREYNRNFVSGGARSHDRFGEFEVTIDEPGHPVMAGVPQKFKITDELYHFQKDPNGPPIQVLATGREIATGKTYPVVWITHHPEARIVCITLGHDGKAHEHPAFIQLLQNSVLWAAGEKSPAKY